MAKIRVYELARELNLKNKALLEKLSEMGIVVSSHMSSLEEEAVTRIKAYVRDKKPGTMERKRVQPTVIRRRRRPEADEQTPREAESHADDGQAPEAVAPPAAATPEPVHEETIEAVAIQKESEAVPPITDAEPPAYAPKAEADLPAPEARAVEAETDAAAAEPAVDTPPPPGVSLKKEAPEAPEFEETALPEIDEAIAAPEVEADRPAPELSDETDTSDGAETDLDPKSKKKKKKKKKKKDATDMPAKIISLPAKAEEEPPGPNQVDDLPQQQAPDIPVPAAPPTEKFTPKVVEKEAAATDDEGDKKKKKENRWAKKKITFNKKEVIEGDALYAKTKGKKGKKGAKAKPVPQQKTQITTPKAIKRRIKIDETIILSDLAKRMGIKANEMIKKLMMLGVMVTVNQTIDFETAALVASEFEYEVEKARFEEDTVLNLDMEDDPEKRVGRSPVVTIMGHVDHGKTSLLDVIRKTRITEIEAGGITQHIGAYNVATERGQITFLDTPGHEAFTSMRARGAMVTDIVVLVVAADDGVMPQTIEAINHSRAAGVPIIVAINKMDKPGADPDRVLRELADQGLTSEDWGGDTIFVRVSAKQNQGIDELLEMILLQAEVLELKANPDKHAKGYVVESKLDSGRGPVATILIQEGTLRAGDPIVCGIHYGKIRAMLNDRGVQVDEAGPAIPVEILGLSGVPNAGDEMLVLEDDKSAKQVSEHRLQKHRALELAKTSRVSLEKLFEKMQEGEVKDLNVILKADVHGSIEALSESLTKLSNEEVTIRIIHAATGTVSESDISLAAVSNAIIIGFNVRPSAKVQTMAQEEHVDMRFYNIIYNVIKDVKDAIVGMMESKFEERVLGLAETREVFHVPKVGTIAGCYVTSGTIKRGQRIRLVRDGVIIHEGKIASLRRFKDDAKEVQSGYECGIGIEGYNDLKVGDIIECFYLEEIKPELQ
ncbi:translation initiation factor IF-2 [Desulfococcus sp.]|uniref:translation initiation factor IF-2 n=1 Tax=Desulfococcus sp. TaxID=2025834 RepID=UPI0035935FFD